MTTRLRRRELFGAFFRRAPAVREVPAPVTGPEPDPLEVLGALRKQSPADVRSFVERLGRASRAAPPEAPPAAPRPGVKRST